jgi:hypothetical protein
MHLSLSNFNPILPFSWHIYQVSKEFGANLISLSTNKKREIAITVFKRLRNSKVLVLSGYDHINLNNNKGEILKTDE